MNGAFLGGSRYFIDKNFHQQLVTSVPATMPKDPEGFVGLWDHVKTHTMMDPWRVASIAKRLWEVRNQPGDVIECGVFMGGTSVLMALLLKRWGIRKRVYMLDSFQGLPAPSSTLDSFYQRGWFAIGANVAEQFAMRSGVRDQVVIMPGWFKYKLPTLTDETFCLAHVDGDLYESTTDCFKYLLPRMADGAVLVMDDYDDGGGGVKRAVREHLGKTGEVLHAAPLPQAYFRVGQKGPKTGFNLSYKELKANKPYCRMMKEVNARMQADAGAVARANKLVNG